MASIAIIGGKLVDGSDRPPLEESTILVKDDRIVKVMEGTHRPLGYDIIDAKGKTVLPGLIDTHAHMTKIDHFEDGQVTDGFLADRDQAQIFSLFLSAGVTTVRDLGASIDRILFLRGSVQRGNMEGPRILCSGPLLDGPEAPWTDHTLVIDDFRTAKKVVKGLHSLGVNCLKLYMNLDPRISRALIKEGHALGLRTTGHFGSKTKPLDALESGIDGIEHIWTLIDRTFLDDPISVTNSASIMGDTEAWSNARLDSPKVSRLVRKIASSGTYFCPTLRVFQSLNVEKVHDLDDRLLAMLPRSMIRSWEDERSYLMRDRNDLDFSVARSAFEKMLRLVKQLDAAGVKITAGTDSMPLSLIPGMSLHQELGLLVEAGLDPSKAIQAATGLAADSIGAGTEVGRVRRGKLADLIVVEGDPLMDIRAIGNIELVIQNGKVISKTSS